MLTWWFNQDLQRVAPYVGDNKTHSLYLQWHPKDHCNQKVVSHTGTSRQGDTWKLQVRAGRSAAPCWGRRLWPVAPRLRCSAAATPGVCDRQQGLHVQQLQGL